MRFPPWKRNARPPAGSWRRSLVRHPGAQTRLTTILVAWLGFVTVQGFVGLILLKAPAQYLLPGMLWNLIPQGVFGALVLWRALRAGKHPLTWTGGAVEIVFAVAFVVAVVFGTQYTGRFIRWLFAMRPDPPRMDIVWKYEYWSTLVLGFAILSTAGRWIGAQRALREEESRAAEAEMLRAEAELAALRARLNPHFLFNTLHTLLALVRRDPAAAERGLEQFGQMMQYALRAGGEQGDCVSVADELRFTRAYLALESLRLGDRLRICETIEPASLSARIPALTLQPLVENAIRHGIGPRPSGGTVTIRALGCSGNLVLEVADDGMGRGAGANALPDGHGIDLVRRRLRAAFGDAARLELEPQPAIGFHVRLTIPEESR
jgi:sensor histidine kinase YesM